MKKLLIILSLPLFMAGCAVKNHLNSDTLKNIHSRNMNNLTALHEASKDLSVKPLFTGQQNTTASLQINKDGLLDKHVSKVPALLLCIAGKVIYEDEKGYKQTLLSGDYVHIEPMVTHWVKGIDNSQLVLIK